MVARPRVASRCQSMPTWRPRWPSGARSPYDLTMAVRTASMTPVYRQYGYRITPAQAWGHSLLTLEKAIIRVTFILSKGADIVEQREKTTDIDWLGQPGRQRVPAGRPVRRTNGDSPRELPRLLRR